ncbi:hypothetical protein [Mycobacteroides chelonae]|uniref:hypothetical protein n=1 Tax=Mycobacteroides chelonae TaxID=1774 RepID=UPI0018B01BAC|nr:hypothetical protein [Mycobacteroides chelonae]MBF9325931.1 hypothetical protein [Mycobacteroides chelonae]MBF9420107.1 hypothetical protein [Mycobacteroides chelonae]
MTEPDDDDELEIEKVALLEESLPSYRKLHGLDAYAYPVIVYLSRPLNDFEAASIRSELSYVPGDDDKTALLIPGISLKNFRDNLKGYLGIIRTAAAKGRKVSDAVYAQDEELKAELTEINNLLH